MKISRQDAQRIAEEDARHAYRDLSLYEVSVVQTEQGWQVDYELRDKQSHGGGPHYLISAETGEILSRRYEQ